MTTTIERPGTEKLTISDCPCCGGNVEVVDCGYSSFNPGHAQCFGVCAREWSLGYVDDRWDAGERWNKRAREIQTNLRFFAMVKVEQSHGISRDFAEEDAADEARKLLKKFEETLIGADVKESR